MAGADEILVAMRQAGQDFARMADTIESRLPAVTDALRDAPAAVRPLITALTKAADAAGKINLSSLITDIDTAEARAGALLKAFGNVQDTVQRIDVKSVVSDLDQASASGSKLAGTLGTVAAETRKQGVELRARNEELAAINDTARKAANATPLSEALVGDIGDFDAVAQVVSQQFQGFESVVKGLGAVLEADATSNMKEFQEMAVSTLSVVASEIAAMEEHGMSFGEMGSEELEKLRKGIEGLSELDPAEQAEKQKEYAAQISKTYLLGKKYTKEFANSISKAEQEARDLFGVSPEAQTKLIIDLNKNILVTEQRLKRGDNRFKVMADHIKGISDAAAEAFPKMTRMIMGAGSAMKDMAKTALGLQGGFGLMSGVKAAMALETKLRDDRRELMQMASEAGKVTSMLGSGLGAADITSEFNKLNNSMDNVLDTWGMTSKDAKSATQALLQAGYSMEDITGATLDASDGLTGLARAGEYAMSGLQEVGRISVITGLGFQKTAQLAGQWREQLGLSIGEVGDTYQDLQNQARRSGLSVSKFMDRVLATSSGLVLFGGRVEDSAKAMSNLMGKMRVPPQMGAQIAGDFMTDMAKTTFSQALETVSFLGKGGATMVEKEAEAVKQRLAKEAAGIGDEIAKLQASGLDPSGVDYLSKMKDLEDRKDKATAGLKRLADVEGDSAKTFQALQQIGEGAKLRLLGEAKKTYGAIEGMKAVESIEEAQKLIEEFGAGVRESAEGIRGGPEELKKFDEMMRSTAAASEALGTFADTVATDSADREAIIKSAEVQDIKGIKEAMEKSGKSNEDIIAELGTDTRLAIAGRRKMLEEQIAAGDIEESEKEEKMADIIAKQIAGIGDKIKKGDKEAGALGEEQKTTEDLIEEHTAAMRRWLGPAGILGLVGVIAAAQAARGAMQMAGGKGIKGVLGKGALPGLSRLGKTALRIGSKAGPIAALATAALVAGGGIYEATSIYDKAKKKALAAGKSEEEASRIAAKKLRSIDSYKKILEKGFSMLLGKTIGGFIGRTLAKAVSWIPGFKSAWGGMVDLGLSVGKMFSAVWDGLKVLWKLIPVLGKLVLHFTPLGVILKVVGALFKTLYSTLGGVLTVFGGLIDVIRGIFTWDMDAITEGLEKVFGGLLGILGAIFVDLPVTIFKAFWKMIKGFAKVFPKILEAVFWTLPGMLLGLFGKFVKALPGLFWKGITLIPKLLYKMFIGLVGWLKEQFGTLINGLLNKLGLGVDEDVIEKGKEQSKVIQDAIKAHGGYAEAIRKGAITQEMLNEESAGGREQVLEKMDIADRGLVNLLGKVQKIPVLGWLTKKAMGVDIEARKAEIGKKIKHQERAKFGGPKVTSEMVSIVGRSKEKDAATASNVSNADQSTWNVHINARSAQELEKQVLKTVRKHQAAVAEGGGF